MLIIIILVSIFFAIFAMIFIYMLIKNSKIQEKWRKISYDYKQELLKNGINSIDKEKFLLQKSEIAYFKGSITVIRERYLKSGTKRDIYYNGEVVVSNKALVLFPRSKPRRLLFKNFSYDFIIQKKLFRNLESRFRYNNWGMFINIYSNKTLELNESLFFVKNNLSKNIIASDDLSF